MLAQLRNQNTKRLSYWNDNAMSEVYFVGLGPVGSVRNQGALTRQRTIEAIPIRPLIAIADTRSIEHKRDSGRA